MLCPPSPALFRLCVSIHCGKSHYVSPVMKFSVTPLLTAFLLQCHVDARHFLHVVCIADLSCIPWSRCDLSCRCPVSVDCAQSAVSCLSRHCHFRGQAASHMVLFIQHHASPIQHNIHKELVQVLVSCLTLWPLKLHSSCPVILQRLFTSVDAVFRLEARSLVPLQTCASPCQTVP